VEPVRIESGQAKFFNSKGNVSTGGEDEERRRGSQQASTHRASFSSLRGKKTRKTKLEGASGKIENTNTIHNSRKIRGKEKAGKWRPPERARANSEKKTGSEKKNKTARSPTEGPS